MTFQDYNLLEHLLDYIRGLESGTSKEVYISWKVIVPI